MRQYPLSVVKSGITRLRDKGGASAQTLYDLLNGYVTAAQTIKMRPGTRIQVSLPAGTKGLVWFKGKFVVFADAVMASTSEYTVEVLKHPTADTTLADIHFAVPFLGYLYVVAEFANGDVYHYWLEQGVAWEAGKVYVPGDLVRPSTANGLMYRLVSDVSGYTPWAANVVRAVDDVVVPTTDNGFKYTVTEVTSSTAKSGTSEPEWPTTDGETVYEDADVESPLTATSSSSAPGTGSATPPASVIDRYGKGNATEAN